MPNKKSFVIVGAGVAGARAAETLRERGFQERIFLVGDEGRLPYDRPPLSKEALVGSVPVESTTLRSWEDWMSIAVHLVLNNPLAALDSQAGQVVLADGLRIHARKVLLATGGVPRRLDVAGADLAGIHYIKTVDDSDVLGDRLRRGRQRVAVVGGGFLATEAASAAVSLDNDVVWLCRSPHPLTGTVGGSAASALLQRYPTKQLDIRRSARVSKIVGDRVRANGVVLDTGEVIEADIIVVAIGHRPALGFMDGIAPRNGVEVDGRLETALPGIFAAGDIANFDDPFMGGRTRHGTWLNAQNQGRYVAGAMLGDPDPYRSVPWHWSDHFGLNVQVAGRVDETAEQVVRHGSGGAETYFYCSGSRLVGAVGINAARDVRGAMVLMDAGVDVGREQLEDADFDLRRAVDRSPRAVAPAEGARN